jgi:diguanylate cyclase (GGDEF)-like protein
LPNRTLLAEHLAKAIALARRQGHLVAVLFLDLDRFKHINDSLGHATGDLFLRSVGERLLASARGSDTVSRHGGDEFVLVLTDIERADRGIARIQDLISAVAAPMSVGGHSIHATVSVGVSLFPGDGEDAETLIRTADTAMYQAKERGRNNFQFFMPEMNARVLERRWIETGLRRAIPRGEFVLHYQSKVSLDTGAITGVEALVRWVNQDRGIIAPMAFVPIAEDCGLIVPIGRWVLREACRQARSWVDAGTPVPVAVNISAIEFRDGGFLDYVRSVLAETGLRPEYLELELTESVLMQNAESSVSVLRALKEIGVKVALDDFGTGYSSLSYLRQFPIDVLKVDQSFVHEITGGSQGSSLVSAVISMGKSLRYIVIAEGVETAQQLAFLQSQQCGEGQGFYFSRPVDADSFAQLLSGGPEHGSGAC